MQSSGVEVSPVRPNESTNLGVYLDSGKELRVSKRPLELPLQDGLEVDGLCTAVVEADSQAKATERLY